MRDMRCIICDEEISRYDIKYVTIMERNIYYTCKYCNTDRKERLEIANEARSRLAEIVK